MITLKLDEAQLATLATILLGAAHADADYDGREAIVIGEILESLVKDGVPEAVQSTVAAFSPDAFDVESACSSLDFNARERHSVFALIARVIEADDVHDLSESTYITRVAKGLGASPEEYAEYVVDFIELNPPPVPS